MAILLVMCSQGPAQEELPLRRFLQKYAADHSDYGDAKGTRYIAAVVHLRDDNTQQVIVYLMGPAWCGTGGCLVLILGRKDSSYSVITEVGLVSAPIRVLDTKSSGWHDLGIWVQGGGIQPGYEAKLSFDGKEYPTNPSVPPGQPITEKVNGKTVISHTSKAQPLHPSEK